MRSIVLISCVATAVAKPVTLKDLKWPGSQSNDLALDDPRLAVPAGRSAEQVHVSSGVDPSSALIVWVTADTAPTSVLYTKHGDAAAVAMTATGLPGERYSFLIDPSPYYPVNTTCIGGKNYTNPDCYYTSGEVHTVILTGLEASTAYEFTVSGDTEMFTFNTGPAVGPDAMVSFAVIGDLGQTENSTHTVAKVADAVKASTVDMVLLAGDLSYADGVGERWDTYARGYEYLFANVKTAYVGGNHEVSSGGENWANYKARYPNQHNEVGSDSFLWYSFDQGPAHIVMMCSYAAFTEGSAQYKWLAADLAAVDRSKTPWVIGMWHTPWYTSNAHHPMSEGAGMRGSMEPLLLQYNVDVVFSGHVHAYERTKPVAYEKVDCDKGITYVTIGDGGNREMFATPWVTEQPDWSAIREFAYGHGQLHIANSTHALWQWVRDDDPWNPTPNTTIGDQAYITRGKRC